MHSFSLFALFPPSLPLSLPLSFSLGTPNGGILNHLTSSNELMPHPYLELTHLDRILEGGIIDQKQATDYQTLVHSSKDHVAICPEVANISGELMYLHAAVTDNNSKVNVMYCRVQLTFNLAMLVIN